MLVVAAVIEREDRRLLIGQRVGEAVELDGREIEVVAIE